MTRYSGADWIQRSLLGGKNEMSPLGRAFADLLGDVFQGIYHVRQSALQGVDWSDSGHQSIVLDGDLANWDSSKLSILVILAHDRMLRVSLEGCGPRYMRLRCWQRRFREGPMSVRMPTMESMIRLVRNNFNMPSSAPEVRQWNGDG